MGFAMVAYPTTLIFRVARTIERALADIKAGKAIAGNDGVNFAEFKDITNYSEWARIEDEYRRADRGSGMKRVIGVAGVGAGCRVRQPRTPIAQTKVRLAVGGQSALYYLPLTVTDRLGYFKDEGSRRRNLRSRRRLAGAAGADRRQRRCRHRRVRPHHPDAGEEPADRRGGAARAVSGIRAGAGRAEGRVLQGPADLKGMKIGVTAPGSSTHFMVLHMMAQAGLKPDDAAFIGVGSGSTAVAAAKRGEIDALVSVDPVISLLDSEKAIRIVADTRTLAGTRAVYGGPYPAAVLYLPPAYAQSNPKTVQSLVNAFVRGLKWIASQSAEEIAKAMPPEYALGNMDAVRPLDPQQRADVFAGRPVQPRERGDRAARCCANSITACAAPTSTWRRPTPTRSSTRSPAR